MIRSTTRMTDTAAERDVYEAYVDTYFKVLTAGYIITSAAAEAITKASAAAWHGDASAEYVAECIVYAAAISIDLD